MSDSEGRYPDGTPMIVGDPPQLPLSDAARAVAAAAAHADAMLTALEGGWIFQLLIMKKGD